MTRSDRTQAARKAGDSPASGENEPCSSREELDLVSLRSAVEKLEILHPTAGYYEVRNPGKLAELPEIVARARSRDEAVRKAVVALRQSREWIIWKREFVRKVVLSGLRVAEWGGRWVVSRSDFKKCLKRIEKNGLGVYGIEAWRPNPKPAAGFDLCGVRVNEQSGQSPMDSTWYWNAFKALASRCPRAKFHCTVSVPKALLGRAHKRAPRR